MTAYVETHLGCGVFCQPQHAPTKRPSADYSQPHPDNFGDFLRRLTFALASTVNFSMDYVLSAYCVNTCAYISVQCAQCLVSTHSIFGTLIKLKVCESEPRIEHNQRGVYAL